MIVLIVLWVAVHTRRLFWWCTITRAPRVQRGWRKNFHIYFRVSRWCPAVLSSLLLFVFFILISYRGGTFKKGDFVRDRGLCSDRIRRRPDWQQPVAQWFTPRCLVHRFRGRPRLFCRWKRRGRMSGVTELWRAYGLSGYSVLHVGRDLFPTGAVLRAKRRYWWTVSQWWALLRYLYIF